MNNSKPTHEYGATFSEILSALTIAGILTYSAIPSLSGIASATTLQNDAQRVAALLELCTVKALLAQDEIILKDHTYELIARKNSNPKKPLLRRSVRKGVEIRLGRPELRFYRTGATTPTTVRLTNATHRCNIALSLRGRTTVSCESK